MGTVKGQMEKREDDYVSSYGSRSLHGMLRLEYKGKCRRLTTIVIC